MRNYNKYIILICLLITCGNNIFAQKQKVKNQPYADQKLFHLGFTLGLSTQDLILSHSGFVNPDNSVWFSEIPSYSPGLSVGIIADRYINQYMNLRIIPTLNFGEKRFVFREQNDMHENFEATIKNNYLSLPIHMRFSSERLNNIRPYVLAGGFINTQIGGQKEPVIKLNNVDYGIEIGLGCNLYFPLFKLSPELRFSFGLKDILEKDRSDLRDEKLLIYTKALNSAKSRMITLTFNFE